MKPDLKRIALMRANGQNSSQIGKFFGITREHVRQYYFSQLNKKSLEEIENIVNTKV